MSVKINLHPLLHHVTGNRDTIEVNGNSVGECLETLVTRFPKARQALLSQDGRLLNYVDIYLNGESAYPDALARPVRDGDELYILLTIAGG